ncbi:MAG TPA: 50S ribosomal protein L30 [Chitinophagaceae bacterium]|nr:50S ribosomal protein L30 [Chitinophagaceae bacterium]
MSKIKITQIKSSIDRPERQKATLKALGLNKIDQTVEHEATPQILGMVKKVQHLVKTENN